LDFCKNHRNDYKKSDGGHPLLASRD